MKRVFTHLLMPAAALLSLSSCVDPMFAYGPGYSSPAYGGGYRSYPSVRPSYSRSSSYYSPARSYSSGYYPRGSYYGSPYRSYSGSYGAYQPIGLPFPGFFGGNSNYYRSSRSGRGLGYYPNDPDDRNNPSHPNYIGPARRYRGGSRGYYPNDPDDRNNPSHPNYIGRSWGSRSGGGLGYYPNDPDDRNNPSHPNYIGRSGSNSRYYVPNHSYHPNDPDDRNNPSHPNYIGPPLN